MVRSIHYCIVSELFLSEMYLRELHLRELHLRDARGNIVAGIDLRLIDS